jgi:hypothetical protein
MCFPVLSFCQFVSQEIYFTSSVYLPPYPIFRLTQALLLVQSFSPKIYLSSIVHAIFKTVSFLM